MIAIFLFYNEAFGVQRKFTFSKDLKHCNILTYDGKDFILTWMDATGIRSKTMQINRIERFFEGLQKQMDNVSSIVSVLVDSRETKPWVPLVLNSCNEVCRLVSGIDIGPTLNAAHLHYTLHRLDKQRNFKIDYSWRRS
jgi:hypothetical protein